jgi:MYXO-CTERM domain-containing protein
VACAPLLFVGAAHAQTNVAWHFGSDSTRQARVDDRGGLGEGYSFSIDYDPADGNSEDFCPACRLTVLVSDPGLDLRELERVGIQRSAIESASGLVSALQSVLSRDPTGLAMELDATLRGADLEARAAEIARIQAEITLVVAALETFARLQGTGFDWSSASLPALIDALSLRMDTAFRGDFSDWNDPRRYNSGVAVYGLPQLLAGLAGAGVSPSVRGQIESTLSSIPGLSGLLEVSGDDDEVLAPAQFHGYRTDLTVRQRTYVVNGHSAYLVVYTISNETTRVFPLVQAAMFADFDIPPISYDSATAFDPAQQMVMVYDTVPYSMPEQHYWFGLAPARALPPTPGQFAFSNWNIDMNISLAQWGSSTTQDNRFRFFLGDPSVSGDHDTATGRSEKQGGIGMTLAGPLLPGDSRSVAFCFAAGEGGSNAAARAELGTVMAGCRALYTALTPSCGDGILQYPEECDGGPGCSGACLRIVCGDGRIDGAEQCDDGGVAVGDGCNATCEREVCGNGRVDAGEECDDGNASNADGCLNECRGARCGDGLVREGCVGESCGCAGYDLCMSGQITIGTAMTGSPFAALIGVPVDYRIGFDVASTDTSTLSLERGIRVTTGPIHVEMSGHPLASSLASAIEGRTMTIDVRASPLRGNPAFNTSRVLGFVGRTQVGLDLMVPSTARAPSYSVDAVGRPILSTVRFTSGIARIWNVPVAGGMATELASGPARGAFAHVPAGSGGELCDDGNASDFDACTTGCIPAACGDGLLQPSVGEECDLGPMPQDWCMGCRRVGDSCGNGTVEAAFGEECDDGNAVDGDGCSRVCRTEACGDGVVQASEECDDGANGDGDGCTDACVIERCGDGIVQPREQCDTGSAVSDGAECTASCVTAACGDGLVHAGVEDCDDGNTLDMDGCSAVCLTERCGDARPGVGEECDDGNTQERDGCTPDCRFELCGDGRPGPDEQCDDGNLADGDGCSKTCQLENLAACGNGSLDPGEQCDDGGRETGDGCNELCQLDDPNACGNGRMDAGEGCDDGNRMAGDGCSAFCMIERCGDGFQQRGEGCDDGNDRDGDGCSRGCLLEPTECGNGTQEYGEQCDGGEGCDEACNATEPAPLGETCGNGMQDYGEQCDDGGRLDGNGCDALCQLEAAVCGNARLERGETCDEGDRADGDGCSASCLLEGEPPPLAGNCGCAVPGRSSAPPLALLALLGAVLVIRRRR